MASFILYSKNSFEKVDRHVIFMICMACTLDHIYIYIHIYFIYTYILSCISVYLTYLSQFHTFSLISLSHLRSQILVLQSRFQLIHWSAGLEDVQFSAKKNFGSMEIRRVWCFFFPCRMTFLPENSWNMRHVRLDVTIFEVCHFSSWSGWIVSISDMPFSQLIGWKTWF